jgi:hydroxymethylbilane synthase
MRVATEDGQSALVRTRAVVSALERANPSFEFHVAIVRSCRRTSGGWADSAAPDGHGAAAALAAALFEDAADMAVQGLCCPAPAPLAGATLAAVTRRADPRDVFISRSGKTLDTLPPGSRVGASTSLRRSQVLRMRPDLTPVLVYGPADAHLRRLVRGDDGLAAIVVGAARLARKGLLGHAAESLPPERFPPARGQGSVGVLTRAGDRAAREAARRIDDPATRAAWEAERSFVEALGAAPASPVGVFARTCDDGALSLTGAVYSPDGAEEVRGEASGPAGSARAIGASLAGRLLDRGALEIMAPAGMPV